MVDATHWSRYNCRTRHARIEGAQRREARAADEVPADVGAGVAWQASRKHRRPPTACAVPDVGEGDGSGFWGHVVDEAVRELKVHPVRERDRRAAGPPLSRRADRKRREVDVR